MRSTIPAFLLLPLIASSQSDFPKCTPNVRGPTWNLRNITYHSSEVWDTPDHGVGSNEITFSLSSTARNFVANCRGATSNVPPRFSERTWFPCVMPSIAIPSDQA
ncbi:hypothetical protein K458DRAFT_488818 [Lentithecium fluviatile CBS 122367]|uniref:AA1-like domain-containing protein n=1 Tax=Lentithecium fluviatile CBS 122367 TaxID=1168545 RepID=A0A6G1IVW4_9PLEO|nr:hypothetical protein K458DRAFT_488818 [Lentithecium fluviatile CBS 122367]